MWARRPSKLNKKPEKRKKDGYEEITFDTLMFNTCYGDICTSECRKRKGNCNFGW